MSARQALWRSESTDRTKDWVFQQKSSNAETVSPSTPTPTLLDVTRSGQSGGPWRTTDKILGKLHLIASKIRNIVSKATGRCSSVNEDDVISACKSSFMNVTLS